MPDLTSWLQAVRQRLAKATPGPWTPPIVHALTEENCDLALHVPTDLTYAVSVIEAAQAVVVAATAYADSGGDDEMLRNATIDTITIWHRVVRETRDG